MLYELLADISQSIEHASGTRAESSSISAAVSYISKNCLSSDIRVSELASLCHMSDANFRRVFALQTGLSPKAYILDLKLDRAEALLRRGDLTVSEVARYVGFDDASYFARIYRKKKGNAPSEEVTGNG